MKKAPLRRDIFEILADEVTVKLLKSALIGFRPRGNIAGKLKITKKQYQFAFINLFRLGLSTNVMASIFSQFLER